MTFLDFVVLAQGGGAGRTAARVFSDLGPWFPPVWTMCMGVLVGLLVVAAIYGIVAAASRAGGKIIEELIFDGLLQPIFYASLVPAAIALLAFPWAPYKEVFAQLRNLEPDAALLLGVTTFVLVLFVLALGLRLAFPKVAAVAQTTCKEGLGHPLFWVCVSLVAFLMLLAIWMPYNTFGEDLKMLTTQGLEMLSFVAVLLAVATSSVSVSQELEGRTALTVLSKPIGRRQFIIGKFLGVLGPVLLMFLILGFLFLGTVSYKVVYEGAESGASEITADHCRLAMVHVIPGLVLRFIAAMMIAAISVAIATRLPMLANLAICFVIYVIGHLMPAVVQSSVGRDFEPVQFMGQLIATVLPVFEHFDVQAGIAGNQAVPLVYLVNTAVYGLCYCLFMLLFALFLFEDRDLA